MASRRSSVIPERPPPAAGVLVAVALIAVETGALYALEDAASPVSLGVVYLLGVLIVSIAWGAGLGILMSLASAAAFNFFHIPPTGRFTVADAENWVTLVAFLVVAIATSSLAEAARHRAREAEQRGREADLAAELARVLLGAADLPNALAPAAQRIAQAFGLASCRIVLESVGDDDRSIAIPLGSDDARLGTLLVPRGAPAEVHEALADRVRPALEALLGVAIERETLVREVVETRALLRSDEIKTAVLRAVSHDLRSPLTAIVAAGEALRSPAPTPAEMRELSEAIATESARLSRLVDKLLELSRLQAGAAEPRRDWCSVEEVLREAVASSGAGPDRVKLMIDRDLPLILADAAQLERAFANLLENALRYSDGQPVSVRARVSGGRLLVRIVDRGPGIGLADQARIFEPFFRAEDGRSAGSGLGLAIVKGFVEANGGHVHVESLPGQGTSFVVALPLPERAEVGTPA
jgi:two-component system sensor histidine kinase KdpD